MAESIHTTLKRQSYVVNHQGNDLEVPLPRWLDITEITKVEDVETWLATKTPEERLGFYHAGFDSSIIKGRAVTRPTMKTIAKLEDFEKAVKAIEDPENWHIDRNRQTITKNILADMDDAIERSLSWKPKAKLVPGSSTPKAFAKGEESALTKMIDALQVNGMDTETIVTILSAKFDRAKVLHAIELLRATNVEG